MALSNSVFSQLKRLAGTIEREREVLQNDLNKTSTSHEEQSRAVLTVREIQQDTRTMKKTAQDTLNSIKADKTFHELLSLVESVVKKQRDRADSIEEYLQHYGFTSFADKQLADAESKKKKTVSKKKVDKENEPPATTTEGDTNEESKADTHTPQKQPSKENTDRKANRTPTLADFGISAFTIDALAKGTSLEPAFNPQTAPSNNFSKPQFSQQPATPMATPMRFAHAPMLSVTPGIGINVTSVDSPSVPMFETPGVRQILKRRPPSPPQPSIPTLQLSEDTAEDSPIPPLLKTPGIKQIKKVIPDFVKEPAPTAPVRNNFDTPEAPDLTIKFENLPQFTKPSYNTSYIENSYIAPTSTQDDSLPEPICVTAIEMMAPSTPETLASKLNMNEFSSPAMPQLTGVYNFNPAMFSAANAYETACEAPAPVEESAPRATSVKQIAPVTCDEYCGLVDYIQRQLSIDYVNSVIDKINEFVSNKCTDGAETSITEAELKNDIGLGFKTKAMLLLLTRLQKVHCNKEVYYIM